MEGTQTGTIKKLIISNGYGFISPSNGGKDIFFNVNDMVDPMSFRELQGGESVEFETTETPKGVKAIRVSLI